MVLEAKSSPLVCFCDDHCPESFCYAKPNSQCYSAVEQVFNPQTGLLENERTYGCLPPDENGFMQCKGHLVPHEIPKSIACCSDEDFCNQKLKPKAVQRLTSPSPMYSDQYSLVTFIASVSACILILVIFIICLTLKIRNKRNQSNCLDVENHGGNARQCLIESSRKSSGSGSGVAPLSQVTIGKQIELLEIVGKGRFGEVWKARLRDESIAVKVFYTIDEASWVRERNIYNTSLLGHKNILGFIGADIRGNGSCTQMLLITDYVELGSLYDYLNKCTLDYNTMLKMAYSASCGLAYLHTEVVGKLLIGKPEIAHCDIKSRNILVKKDKTCVLADFGLAIKFNRESYKIDVANNPRAGTIRYMAPEVLDETIDRSRFESYKMADIYSFSLVLWEIARRCVINGVVEEYQIPFYEYVSSNPSFEEMRAVVCVDQTRPQIPKHWDDSDVMAILSNVIQECWRENAGARLTAYRVKKTLSKLELFI